MTARADAFALVMTLASALLGCGSSTTTAPSSAVPRIAASPTPIPDSVEAPVVDAGPSELVRGTVHLAVTDPLPDGATHAVEFLAMLEASGVTLARLSGVREGVATVDGALAVASDDWLDVPDWLTPPSVRRRATSAAATAVGRDIPIVGNDEGTWGVRGLRVDDETSIFVVTHEEYDTEPTLLCVARAGITRCARTELVDIEGFVRESSTGWLVLAASPVGGERDRARELALVTDSMSTDTLSLGAMTGEGMACEHESSYCVAVAASPVRARFVASDCVEVEALAAWEATHVRARDRWRDEHVSAAPGCVRRYVVGERFEPSDCGPPGWHACADDGASVSGS